MSDDLRANMPTLKPPDANLNSQIRDKGRFIVHAVLVVILTIPAILYALFRKIFPQQGKSLKNKVALVTGAGRGLGRSLAIRLAKEGCLVACVDVNQMSVTETAKIITRDGYKAQAYVTNVGCPKDINKLADSVVKDLGPVDILVNNAALIVGHGIMDVEDDHIKGIVTVNFLSHFWMIRAFLPSMKERNSGHIVCISSISAVVGLGNATTYTSCKWAVTGLMESLNEELKQIHGNDIKVTTVFPYFINTSEDYTQRWKITLPELSIDDVVEPVVQGIKRDYRYVAIPEHIYIFSKILKLLPVFIQDLSTEAFKVTFNPPKREEWNQFPVYSIIADLEVEK